VPQAIKATTYIRQHASANLHINDVQVLLPLQ